MSSGENDLLNLSREELFEMVWTESVNSITKEFLVSPVSFRKICEDNQIPLLGKGYWSKVCFNKAPDRPKLPECSDCPEIVTLYRRKEGDNRNLGLVSEFHKIKQEIEIDPSLNLSVPQRLSKPDPIVQNSLSILEDLKKGKKQKNKTYSYYLPQVSEGIQSRAFRILDTLFKAFRDRGYQFKFTDRDSIIIVNDMELKIRMREKHKRVIDSYIAGSPYHRLEPIGIIAFSVERSLHSKEWTGSKTKPLEGKISTILAGIELFAKNEKEYQARLEKGWANQRERVEREKAIKEKEEADERKLQSLLDQSDQWHRVNIFRQFLDHLEALNQKKKDPEQEELIRWAREKADRMDPLYNQNNN